MIHPSLQEEDVFQPLPLKRTERNTLRFRDPSSMSEKGNDLWLLTLSDLLLLLTIFFLVLFGMTIQQEHPGSPPPQLRAATATKSEAAPVMAQPAEVPESAPKAKLASLEKDLLSALGDEEGREDVSLTRRADHLVLTFPERIVFDPGRAELKPAVEPILDKVASLASSYRQLLVEVQGHTDDRPIHTQRYPSNWELSVDRATQVAKALIGLGLDPAQMTVKGFGEYRTLQPNDTDSNRQKNRRVEIQFFFTP